MWLRSGTKLSLMRPLNAINLTLRRSNIDFRKIIIIDFCVFTLRIWLIFFSIEFDFSRGLCTPGSGSGRECGSENVLIFVVVVKVIVDVANVRHRWFTALFLKLKKAKIWASLFYRSRSQFVVQLFSLLLLQLEQPVFVKLGVILEKAFSLVDEERQRVCVCTCLRAFVRVNKRCVCVCVCVVREKKRVCVERVRACDSECRRRVCVSVCVCMRVFRSVCVFCSLCLERLLPKMAANLAGTAFSTN